MKFPRISSRDLHCKIKMSVLKSLCKLYHVSILFDMAAFVKLKLMPSSTQGKRVTFFLTFFFFFFFFFKPVELMNGTPREHSLICKGSVEVLVLDREVRILF